MAWDSIAQEENKKSGYVMHSPMDSYVCSINAIFESILITRFCQILVQTSGKNVQLMRNDIHLSFSRFTILTLYDLMDSSFWFDTIYLVCSIVITNGQQVIFFTLNVSLSLKIVFVLANIVDSDEIPH